MRYIAQLALNSYFMYAECSYADPELVSVLPVNFLNSAASLVGRIESISAIACNCIV